MSEQPFYKYCDFCGHYLQTFTSKDKRVCTRFPQYVDREPDDTCGEWVCARCWIPWDMVIQQDDDLAHVNIVDHTKCPEVNLNSLPYDITEVQE